VASDLLQIGASGARAARAALDVSAQNIANAATEGYVRRSVQLAEVATAGGWGRVGDISLSGVRIAGVVRNADQFRQSEVRRTVSDAARAGTDLTAMENITAAIEQADVFPALTDFEAALQRLGSDPVDPALRAAVLEAARTSARTFNLAASSLDAAGESLRFEAADGVAQVNLLATELARVNLRLARAVDASSDQAALLDQRDSLLERLAQQGNLSTSIAADHTVTVRLGGSGGPLLVSGGTAGTLAATTAADGTLSFMLDGTPLVLAAGRLAGQAQALVALRDTHLSLDSVAASLAATANAVQASGVALDGSAGLPLFAGSNAAGLSLALTSGAGLATAPAGAGPGSRDPANLDALKAALAGADVPGQLDRLLFSLSSGVAARRVGAEAIDAIALSARIALDQQAGVDLDAEAVDLVRFQQAFQASGKVMQVATTLFDTILAIR
jgi:flagellar hook-associated protein 1 FlgK